MCKGRKGKATFPFQLIPAHTTRSSSFSSMDIRKTRSNNTSVPWYIHPGKFLHLWLSRVTIRLNQQLCGQVYRPHSVHIALNMHHCPFCHFRPIQIGFGLPMLLRSERSTLIMHYVQASTTYWLRLHFFLQVNMINTLIFTATYDVLNLVDIISSKIMSEIL